MKFKIDENLPPSLVGDLRAAGHDADTVADQSLTGSSDAVLMGRVQAESRVFFTMDKGIADIRRFPPWTYFGIVLFRPKTSGLLATLGLVRRHLPQLLQLDLKGRLAVVTETSIRIR
jgi:hypothetical protein